MGVIDMRDRQPSGERCTSMNRIVLVVLGGLVLANCSDRIFPEGNFLSEELIASIESGTTTQDEVLETFGPPSSVGTFSPRHWYYIGQYTRPRAFLASRVYRRQVVAVSFDETGVVEQLELLNLADGQEISPSGQVTPTSGTEISLWQQLVGNIGRFPS